MDTTAQETVQEDEYQDSPIDDCEVFELDMIDPTCLQSDQ